MCYDMFVKIKKIAFNCVWWTMSGLWFTICLLALCTQKLSFKVLVKWSAYTLWICRRFGIKTKIDTSKIANFSKIKGPCLILSRHEAVLDIPLIADMLQDNFTFVAKKELFEIPLFGWYLKKSGAIQTSREVTIVEGRHMIREIEKNLLNNKIVVIFPQGTRTPIGAKPEGKYAYNIALLPVFYKKGYPIFTAGLDTKEYWDMEKTGTTTLDIQKIPEGLTKEELQARIIDSIESMTNALHAKK